MTRLRFTQVERGGPRTAYSATIELDGNAVGYVQKVRGGRYMAYVGGSRVAEGETLAELRADLREHFAHDYPDAQESW